MDSTRKALALRLVALEGPGGLDPRPGRLEMEFHVSRRARDRFGIEGALFKSTGNLVIPDFHAARVLARRINERTEAALRPERAVRAGRLNAMALIDEILHDVARLYREKAEPGAFTLALADIESAVGRDSADALLLAFVDRFPPAAVYAGEATAAEWLAGLAPTGATPEERREQALEELLLLRLANENPAFAPFRFLFDEEELAPAGSALAEALEEAVSSLERRFAALPAFGPDAQDLVAMLRSPAAAAPYSLPGQLDYIRSRWGLVLGERALRLLGALDLIREEEKPFFPGPGPARAYVYSGMEREYERFTEDRDWMPNVVMMAKSTLVWLHQLSVAYGRDIRTLDAIPDEELDALAGRGFNALWLIGLWERSAASAEIKRRCGNPEAAASAYSLFDYEIAAELGGWAALGSLRERCRWRGIRLAADMVPNHTGIDSAWVRDRPELFVQRPTCPFPGYTFGGGELSGDGRVSIRLEDHYYDRTDAAVVFERRDAATGRASYIYHGNDGTGLPWSDTAQIDFLKPEAREAVKERILHVARNFPIIRFDAAMILAKKHFRRLWYPEPGSGGDIPSRSERAMDQASFDAAMPEEFWREVVDLCAREAGDTLLLAEAFWMMEGYFVRTLGMHRVYNSAFMNMLKREENAKYRETIRNTQEFDKDILKRFVNFMNNPDEETAVAQFGKGDKYFGVCSMMATMPGLPMFGHGQLEGFEEKYGMEYRRAYRDERPDAGLLARHEREVFPLLKRRYLFSGVESFLLYDLVGPDGSVNENVFAYSNGAGEERALFAYNNAFARAHGRIKDSCPYAEKLPGGGKRAARSDLAAALGLSPPTGGPERFLVMREQRSGLWYLRDSREIRERGLALVLDGYECQVFLDVFEAEDGERRLYRQAHDALGGAGTPDLSASLQDAALKDLYAALARLATPELLAWAAGVGAAAASGAAGPAARASPAAPKGLPAGVLDAARAFYRAARAELRLEAAEEGLPGDPPRAAAPAAGVGRGKRQAKAGPGPLGKADAVAALAAERLFSDALAALAGLPETLARTAGRGRRPPAASPRAAAARLLARELGAPWAAQVALCHAILGALAPVSGSGAEGARRVVDRFGLERKLREALREAGMHGDEAYRSLALARALMAVPAADGRGFLAGLESDAELRSCLGVNVFDGVTWYNKEKFEEAVRRWALLGAVAASARAARRAASKGAGKPAPSAKASGGTGATATGPILAAARSALELERASEAAAYSLDRLRELFGRKGT